MAPNRITMPALQPPPITIGLQHCVPYLVVTKDTGEQATAILGRDDTVLYFSPDGSITYSHVDSLKSSYKIVRSYSAGETLTFTKG